MTPARTLLLIADIGGYTDYMRTHRMSLAHAEVNTARLLETVIDAAPGFDLLTSFDWDEALNTPPPQEELSSGAPAAKVAIPPGSPPVGGPGSGWARGGSSSQATPCTPVKASPGGPSSP